MIVTLVMYNKDTERFRENLRKEDRGMKKLLVLITLLLAMVFSTATVFGASDPAVTIVNPTDSSTSYSTNLLVSVKITKPKTIRVRVTEEKKKINDVLYSMTLDEVQKAQQAKAEGKPAATVVSVALGETETYTTSNNLSFYTKKFEKVTPGVYRIRVETLSAGQVIYSSENLVVMKEKEAEAANMNIFSTNQSGTTTFLQNLLKTIFGN
jgi:hypothetical protein